MGFFKNFFRGVGTYSDALRFSSKHRLWGYYVLPVLLNLLLFGAVIVSAVFFAGDLVNYAEKVMHIQTPTSTLAKALHGVVIAIVWVAVLFLYLKIYRYLMLMLLSPVLGLIAEKVQEILHGAGAPEIGFTGQVRNIFRAIGTALRDLVLEMSLSAGLFFLGIVLPFLAPVIAVFVILMESYFLGLSMLDYRNEFVGMTPKESRKLIWQYRGLAIGNGLTFTLLLLIPVAGILVAPVLSVIAAGIGIHEAEEAKKLQQPDRVNQGR